MERLISATFQRLNYPVVVNRIRTHPNTVPKSISNSYTFYRARVAPHGKEFLLALPASQIDLTFLREEQRRLESLFDKPVVFILVALSEGDRNKLLRWKVQCLVPGEYIYFPALRIEGVVLPHATAGKAGPTDPPLSTWSEAIIIKQLLDDSIQGLRIKDVSQIFDVTPIVMSRALRELEDHGLLYLVRTVLSNRTVKQVLFPERSVLWQRALPLLSNPVMGVVTLSNHLPGLTRSGGSALAHYTGVRDIESDTYAISKRDLPSLERQGYQKLNVAIQECQTFKVQLWRRNPAQLAEDGYVDRISLFLSLRGLKDERIAHLRTKLISDLGLTADPSPF